MIGAHSGTSERGGAVAAGAAPSPAQTGSRRPAPPTRPRELAGPRALALVSREKLQAEILFWYHFWGVNPQQGAEGEAGRYLERRSRGGGEFSPPPMLRVSV